jgi:hypothetical protein
VLIVDEEHRVLNAAWTGTFGDGVYERFAVTGPLRLTARFFKHRSACVAVSAAFLDPLPDRQKELTMTLTRSNFTKGATLAAVFLIAFGTRGDDFSITDVEYVVSDMNGTVPMDTTYAIYPIEWKGGPITVGTEEDPPEAASASIVSLGAEAVALSGEQTAEEGTPVTVTITAIHTSDGDLPPASTPPPMTLSVLDGTTAGKGSERGRNWEAYFSALFRSWLQRAESPEDLARLQADYLSKQGTGATSPDLPSPPPASDKSDGSTGSMAAATAAGTTEVFYYWDIFKWPNTELNQAIYHSGETTSNRLTRPLPGVGYYIVLCGIRAVRTEPDGTQSEAHYPLYWSLPVVIVMETTATVSAQAATTTLGELAPARLIVPYTEDADGNPSTTVQLSTAPRNIMPTGMSLVWPIQRPKWSVTIPLGAVFDLSSWEGHDKPDPDTGICVYDHMQPGLYTFTAHCGVDVDVEVIPVKVSSLTAMDATDATNVVTTTAGGTVQRLIIPFTSGPNGESTTTIQLSADSAPQDGGSNIWPPAKPDWNLNGDASDPLVSWDGTDVVTYTLMQPGEYILAVECGNCVQVAITAARLISDGHELWSFGGEDAANYDERTTVSLLGPNPATTGACSWAVTGPIAIENSSPLTATLVSMGASTTIGDAVVTATYMGRSFAMTFTVLEPRFVADPSPPQVVVPLTMPYTGLKGFRIEYHFTLRDQFGVPMPFEIEVNESFGAVSNNIANDWPKSVENGSIPGQIPPHAYDRYVLPPNSWTPRAVHPGETGYMTRVFSKPQKYYIGSQTGGRGVMVKSHTEQWRKGYTTQD